MTSSEQPWRKSTRAAGAASAAGISRQYEFMQLVLRAARLSARSGRTCNASWVRGARITLKLDGAAVFLDAANYRSGALGGKNEIGAHGWQTGRPAGWLGPAFRKRGSRLSGSGLLRPSHGDARQRA